MSRQDPRAAPLWLWASAMVLIAVASVPSLRWLLRLWLGSPYYGHGFLIPLVSAILAFRSARTSVSTGESNGPKGAAPGLSLLTAGVALHLVSLPRRVYGASVVGLLLAVAGLLWAWAGPATLRRHAFPLAFLLLAIPIPGLESLTPQLARAVARASAELAKLTGVAAHADGARVTLANTSLVIGAPCSGLSSLVALTTIAVLYAHLVSGSLTSKLVLVALAVPLALAANLLRVWLLVVAAHLGVVDVAQSPIHGWSSPVLYLLSLALLVSIGRLLGCRGIRSDI